MNKNTLLTILLSTFGVLLAQPDWEDCPGCYEFTATMTAGVYDENGLTLGDDGDILAALDADGAIRGLGTMLDGLGPSAGMTLHAITIRSNAGGDIISFKYYDASEDVVLDIVETYEFVINDVIGGVIEPWVLNISTIAIMDLNIDLHFWFVKSKERQLNVLEEIFQNSLSSPAFLYKT